jgi:hypothetical protein
MLDPTTIDALDCCEEGQINAHVFDTDIGDWRWAWVPIPAISEAGRYDILEYFGLDDGGEYRLAA